MKHTLTIAFILSTTALFAQTQTGSRKLTQKEVKQVGPIAKATLVDNKSHVLAPTKPQKVAVVTMYEEDVKALVHFLEAYKATVIYQPAQTDRSAVQTQKDLDAYLGYIMQSAILKRDSVPAPTPATK